MRERLGNPAARAMIQGDTNHPDLKGMVEFYHSFGGTLVMAEVTGLEDGMGKSNHFHGFHVHAGAKCAGTAEEPFADADGHYNPGNTGHPNHAGDLPPLLANQGNAWMMVYTNRFYPEDVVGKTVIIHENPDDFKTQPSGNSGAMIACGEIAAAEE